MRVEDAGEAAVTGSVTERSDRVGEREPVRLTDHGGSVGPTENGSGGVSERQEVDDVHGWGGRYATGSTSWPWS